MKKLISSVLVFVLVFVSISFPLNVNAATQKPTDNDMKKVITVGALLSLQGTWSESGIAAKKTLETSLKYVNSYLNASGIEMQLDIRDTKSNPEEALKELKSLKKKGINTVIGPMSSEESLKLLKYANENSMLLLSPAATSSELSKKDNFFRLVPTDASQVDGLTTIMKEVNKIEHLIVVYMDDSYGKAYYDQIKEKAKLKDIDIISSVSISSNKSDYTEAAKNLKKLAANVDSKNTAVALISSSQIASGFIMNVLKDNKLASMKWFTSADVAGNKDILKKSQVAQFLVSTRMEGLGFGYKGIALDALPYIASLLDGAIDKSAFGIMTWDSIWLLAYTYATAPDADFEEFKENLTSCSNDYRNASGTFNILDENGDTKGSKFMRYICVKENDTYTWSANGHIVDIGTGKPIIQTMEEKISKDTGIVKIGALLPLSGNHAENGKEIYQVVKYAVDQFNLYANSCNSDLKLSLVVEDTESDPVKAKEAAQKLIDMGIKGMIGPVNSSELSEVKPLIDQANIIDMAPLVTATSLSCVDRIYRPILNDSVQAKAFVSLLNKKGIEKLVVINSDDTYGNDFITALKGIYKGEISSFSYLPTDKDYSLVLQKANDAVKSGDKTKTAVLAISYDEIKDIIKLVDKYTDLKDVNWYGTDSSAISEGLISDKETAENAIKVNFISMDYSPYGNKFDPLFCVISKELDMENSLKESSASAFDCIWMLGCVYLAEGVSADTEVINKYVATKAFHGVGGIQKFDANGDRQFGYYKFYRVTKNNDSVSWKKIGIYSIDMANQNILNLTE